MIRRFSYLSANLLLPDTVPRSGRKGDKRVVLGRGLKPLWSECVRVVEVSLVPLDVVVEKDDVGSSRDFLSVNIKILLAQQAA